MIPFRNIFQLSTGDIIAKTLYFLAFAYLARILGVEKYGTLEFALSILTYLLILGDGGLELWATRASAQNGNVRQLAGTIVPLRLLLAGVTFLVLLILLPVFPDYPDLRLILVLLGLVLFVQAVSLKWAFMGQEKMNVVATGLILGQLIFSAVVFIFFRTPEALIWVPVLRLVSDLIMALFFGWLFIRANPPHKLNFSLRGAWKSLKTALPMGTSHLLALMSFNFDTVLLGFMLDSTSVGWYSAAYKPISVVLALPVAYFLALFPALSRTFLQDKEAFQNTVLRSFSLTSVFSIPIGVGGTFLALPIINLLFGPEYQNSVPAMQILAWSAMLVILRGTFRQALNAAGHQTLDLRSAGISVLVNLMVNLLLIPRFGILGAATATVISEFVWLTTAWYLFSRNVAPINLLGFLFQPCLAAIVMALWMLVTPAIFWPIRAVIGLLIYFSVLLLLGDNEVRSWIETAKLRL